MFRALPSVLSVSTTIVCLVHPVWAAPASSGILSALQKKYVVAETTADSEQITKDGTTMVMKCAGVYSLPSSALIKFDNKVVEGKVQKPNFMMSGVLSKSGSHVLQTGDKVYVTKMEIKNDGGGDTLRFAVLTVDSLDVSGSDAKKKFDAAISFKFKKGYLDEAPPDEVEQTIEAVLAPDAGADAAGGGQQEQQQPQQQAPASPPARAAAPPLPAPAPAPATPAPTITIGESSTEVLQAMGMPLQMIDLGKKKTYVYKNMKIVFVNDKVSDVQ